MGDGVLLDGKGEGERLRCLLDERGSLDASAADMDRLDAAEMTVESTGGGASMASFFLCEGSLCHTSTVIEPNARRECALKKSTRDASRGPKLRSCRQDFWIHLES